MSEKIDETDKKFRKATNNFKKIAESVDNFIKPFIFVKEQAEKAEWDGEHMSGMLSSMRDLCDLNNPLIRDQLNLLENQAKNIVDSSERILNSMEGISNDFGSVTGAISQSNMNMGKSTITTYHTLQQYGQQHPSLSFNIEPFEQNPYRKRDNLIQSFQSINPYLKNKINEISRSFQTQDTIETMKETAHSLREFMSEFLQNLDLTNEVKKMPWYEPSNGNPTQKSRVIYAIIGNDADFDESYSYHTVVIDLATRYRKLYKSLNKLAHKRKKITLIDMRTRLKIDYSLFFDYTKNILDLRELYSPKTKEEDMNRSVIIRALNSDHFL